MLCKPIDRAETPQTTARPVSTKTHTHTQTHTHTHNTHTHTSARKHSLCTQTCLYVHRGSLCSKMPSGKDIGLVICGYELVMCMLEWINTAPGMCVCACAYATA